MADPVSYGNANRNTEQVSTPNSSVALIALKKGSQLLKYGRKGKPKFCPFRLSNDESSLIWISTTGEKSLKLASVSRIIPGQRTAVFQRFLRPEKDYLSFSLIYNNGKRSLDLICKDKVEVEIWIAGLKALIGSGDGGRSKIDGWNDGGLYQDDNSDLTSSSPSDSSNSVTRDISSPEVCVSFSPNKSPTSVRSENSTRSHVPLKQTNMQAKGSSSDIFRVSVSSAPSSSSHGSTPDDCDALGDIYIWGEVISDNFNKPGADSDISVNSRTDVLLPKPLESNIVLDAQHIACGVRHSAIVTRQGEVFTWGEESGGRLGLGMGKDVTHPRLVEALAATTVDLVACGEFHTCAVTMDGELYTWGDGIHNAGLLGNGTYVSHWMPKRITGILEGLQVASVACGPWHTALISSMGQLFTFGDGTFGVLGHGNKKSISYPRVVESLSGLRTIAVACGVWHTAAVVEVIMTQSSTSISSGKLFTWGDGDKNRLGHGDKEPRLKPTCVPALIEYNFHKIACGHSITVGLTTSGQVFTVGSSVYGQLGNPNADGKQPCLVEDKLSGESAEEVACGAYHVMVLTSKNEIYTWGKGANGRLGHGDVEDRKSPTLVEALKDKHVKIIACGSNYSAAICLHKSLSGTEQSQCSSCRQAFGFTRKRHNCYNCGLVHCHSCSSKKALRAALAPTPRKSYRVCDSCYAKLSKASESGINYRKNAVPRLSGESRDKLDKSDTRPPKTALSNMDLIKQLDSKAAKQGKRTDTFSIVHPTQAHTLLQLKDGPNTVDIRRLAPKPIPMANGVNSRSVSPLSRKSSPPRSATPVPTASGLSFSKGIADSLKKTNELLNQEVLMLRAQVESLRKRCELQESELRKSEKKAQEAIALAAEESTKSKSAKEVIKSLTAQIKDMAERLPDGVKMGLPGTIDSENVRTLDLPNGMEQNVAHHLASNGERHSESDSHSSLSLASSVATDYSMSNGFQGPANTSGEFPASNETNSSSEPGRLTSDVIDDDPDVRLSYGHRGVWESRRSSSMSEGANSSGLLLDSESNTRLRSSASPSNDNQVEAEWIEQYEPGVYITLMALRDGTRDLKRVRFSRRRFGEHQAESWWSENRDKVYEKYNVRGTEKSSISSNPA
ncbi:PH, RCC1 and FYVE domains-containing protein 1-like isoform X1 [Cucurbita moschata]|uniref:PH, RCC1 and FYVE domains-containing protein 1-like isoform X1 n=1 Tax=Cucurbita moschata TaxID=3662 RepID=A0A6J1F9J5_CUCMO|nr:PH, RCC1 and FYVE domains-containing protein 1-like isoform X1 [Cucurbita moschata]